MRGPDLRGDPAHGTPGAVTPYLFLATLAVGASPEVAPFDLAWFAKTPEYKALVAAAAKPDASSGNAKLSKEEVDAFLGRVKVSGKELEWVEKYASPLSPKRQSKRVRSVMHILTSKSRLALGRKFRVDHAKVLERVSAKYDVSIEDLLAMMNTESRFGEVQGSFVVGQVFVANMAYLAKMGELADKRGDYDTKGAVSRKKNAKRIKKRVRYAVRNLATLLKYARSREMDPLSFKGSWAGAIGITQFMPASLKWAVDGDEDGVVDLSRIPDAVASTANYLVVHGYRRGDRDARAKAFRAYNPNDEYVRAILAYADKIRRT